MVAVKVRVDHVLHRLAGHLLQLRHDVVVIDLELVVDQDDPLVGDECGRVARNEVVVNDVQVVLDFHQIELGRLLAELGVNIRTEQCKRQQRDKTGTHPHQTSPAESGALILLRRLKGRASSKPSTHRADDDGREEDDQDKQD